MKRGKKLQNEKWTNICSIGVSKGEEREKGDRKNIRRNDGQNSSKVDKIINLPIQ